MNYNISGFTHIGTKRQINQDRILVNEHILEKDFQHLSNLDSCFCFVADGIGGGLAGEIASQYVLEAVLKLKNSFLQLNEKTIKNELYSINNELIAYSSSKQEYLGTGTTLTGLIVLKDASYMTINAGDSEIWVLRDNLFFQITESQVFDDAEHGSPLISYFGGKKASLELSLNSSLREIRKNDIIVISSDGLLNSLIPKQLKAILSNEKPLKEKLEFILEKSLKVGANDNVSCILVEVLNN